ncbi:MAG TPA: hypothetical protein VHW46_14765 [Terracidiphilus sp.]|jgi:hypothetical protein|nr:hypothetical protein [Terracidiphilus sp.]
MKNAAFDEFVKSQQVPADPEIDWNKERDEWLGRLNELYERIEEFLKEYIASGQIQVTSDVIGLNEENIGAYSAPQVTLKIGRKQVKLQPVGTLLIGSKGRVDVVGPTGTVSSLMLIDSKATRLSDMFKVYVGVGGKPPVIPKAATREIKWEWKMVTRPPERRFIELTQDTFFQMILEVSNG